MSLIVIASGDALVCDTIDCDEHLLLSETERPDIAAGRMGWYRGFIKDACPKHIPCYADMI